MSIEFTPINGKHPLIDYNQLENEILNSLQKTCSEAKVYIFNKFPVCLSPEVNIDIMLVIALKDISSNTYRFDSKEGKKYLKNIIMPISFNTVYSEGVVSIIDNDVVADGDSIDFSTEMYVISKELRFYIVNKCKILDDYITIYPIKYLFTKTNLFYKDHIFSNKFSFEMIAKYIS